MFKLFKRDQPAPISEPSEPGFMQRLKATLTKTRQQLGSGIARLLLGRKEIEEELFKALEMQLLAADIGVKTTQMIIQQLTDRVQRRQLTDGTALYQELQLLLTELLQPLAKPLTIPEHIKPYVILVVGVNGAGKTTSIGKLAKQLQQQGKKVLLAAGDTFRAAAVEQLQVWGERNQIPVIAQKTGADSAAVIYDALVSAKARQMDVMIADTAGRLHTQSNLMAELAKIKRVLAKLEADAPHEVLLVLDASIGQNTLIQAQQFLQAVGVTGIAMTKLDGTAKGGVLFAVAHECQLPIRFIGVGEQIDDLKPLQVPEFIEALFSQSDVEAGSDSL